MTVTRRSFMWPLVIILLGSMWLLTVAGAFPEAVEDIFSRAWPALLLLFGFDVLMGRRRVRAGRLTIDTSYAGLVVTVVLVVGVVFFAYRKQADVVRSDNVETFTKVLPDAIEHVSLSFDLERTAVRVVPAGEFQRQLSFDFAGSNESELDVVWELQDDTGVLTVSEDYGSTIPRLEDYGRAEIVITLPIDVAVDVFDLSLGSGDVALDLSPVTLPVLALELDEGNVQITLPEADVMTGDVRIGRGDLELRVPAQRTLNVQTRGDSSPDFSFDRDRYDLLVGGELKNTSAVSFDYSINVWMSGAASVTVTDVP